MRWMCLYLLLDDPHHGIVLLDLGQVLLAKITVDLLCFFVWKIEDARARKQKIERFFPHQHLCVELE